MRHDGQPDLKWTGPWLLQRWVGVTSLGVGQPTVTARWTPAGAATPLGGQAIAGRAAALWERLSISGAARQAMATAVVAMALACRPAWATTSTSHRELHRAATWWAVDHHDSKITASILPLSLPGDSSPPPWDSFLTTHGQCGCCFASCLSPICV